jgi:hypothetical protein
MQVLRDQKYAVHNTSFGRAINSSKSRRKITPPSNGFPTIMPKE